LDAKVIALQMGLPNYVRTLLKGHFMFGLGQTSLDFFIETHISKN